MQTGGGWYFVFCIVIGGFSWLCVVLYGIASGGLFWHTFARRYGCPDYVESTPGGAQTGITGLLFAPISNPSAPGKRKGQVNLTCPLFLSLSLSLEAKIDSVQSFQTFLIAPGKLCQNPGFLLGVFVGVKPVDDSLGCCAFVAFKGFCRYTLCFDES